MLLTVLFHSLLAQSIPGVAELLRIVVVVVILLIIIVILNVPQIQIPAPFKQWAIWIVSAIIVIYLVWQALVISGVV